MQGFEDIKLEWDGETYIVEPERQMRLIGKVEASLLEHNEGKSAGQVLFNGGATAFKIADAYATALNYAGAQVPGLVVYEAIMAGLRVDDRTLRNNLLISIARILHLLTPDESVAVEVAEDADEKKDIAPAA